METNAINTAAMMSDFIVWGVGFIVLQITLFIGFVYRMNVKFEKFRTEYDLNNKNMAAEFLEIKNDMEDQRIAHENRIKEVSESLRSHYQDFHTQNNSEHKIIVSNVDYIKNVIVKVQQDVAYMRGTLDQHITNSPHKENSPRSPRARK